MTSRDKRHPSQPTASLSLAARLGWPAPCHARAPFSHSSPPSPSPAAHSKKTNLTARESGLRSVPFPKSPHVGFVHSFHYCTVSLLSTPSHTVQSRDFCDKLDKLCLQMTHNNLDLQYSMRASSHGYRLLIPPLEGGSLVECMLLKLDQDPLADAWVGGQT